MKRHRSRGFTLLELMVCLGIISLMGSLVATKGYQLFSYHQFRCISQTFLADLNRWQIVAMAQGCDVKCKIQENGSIYKVQFEPDMPVMGVERLNYELKCAEKMQFQGKILKKFEFTLFSSGRISDQGVLTLIPKQEEKALSIDLSYPVVLEESKSTAFFQKRIIPSYPKRKKK